MKHALIIASLLLIQASAFAQTRAGAAAGAVNLNDPALNGSSKRDCWKRHSAGGDTAQPRLIRANSFVPSSNPLDNNARSRSTI